MSYYNQYDIFPVKAKKTNSGQDTAPSLQANREVWLSRHWFPLLPFHWNSANSGLQILLGLSIFARLRIALSFDSGHGPSTSVLFYRRPSPLVSTLRFSPWVFAFRFYPSGSDLKVFTFQSWASISRDRVSLSSHPIGTTVSDRARSG
jgi:hypothetical protein